MTEKPITPASLRGAVDLSSLARPAQSAPTGGAPSSGDDQVVRQVDDTTFGDVAQLSVRVPVIFAVYSARRQASKDHADLLARLVRGYGGRLVLATADIDQAMQIRQALQVQQVPMVLALLQGQPLPLYVGDQPEETVTQVLDKVLEAAAANGVTGTVQAGTVDQEEQQEEEPELPPLHQEAYDAIERGDLDAAVAAYEKAIKQNPQDEDAKLGLGQVTLLRRTQGVDLAQARAAAADAPTDVDKQTMVADLDVLGGHVEDAFTRLIDLVKATAGDERNAAREHLVGLFAVVGASDARVKAARMALMSALY